MLGVVAATAEHDEDVDASSEASGSPPRAVTKARDDPYLLQGEEVASVAARGSDPLAEDPIVVIEEETREEKKKRKKKDKEKKKEKKRVRKVFEKAKVAGGMLVIDDDDDSTGVLAPPIADPSPKDAAQTEQSVVDHIDEVLSVPCQASALLPTANDCRSNTSEAVSKDGELSAVDRKVTLGVHIDSCIAEAVAGTGNHDEGVGLHSPSTLQPFADTSGVDFEEAVAASPPQEPSLSIRNGANTDTVTAVPVAPSKDMLQCTANEGVAVAEPIAVHSSVSLDGERNDSHACLAEHSAGSQASPPPCGTDAGTTHSERATTSKSHTEAASQETDMLLSAAPSKIDLKGDSLHLVASSMWPENVYQNGHHTVWGSWYDTEVSRWGYACCKTTDRLALCDNPLASASSKKRKHGRTFASESSYDWSDPPTTLAPRDKVLLTAELLAGNGKQGAFVAHFIRFAIGAWRRMVEGGTVSSDEHKHQINVEHMPHEYMGIKALEQTEEEVAPLMHQLHSNSADPKIVEQLDNLVALAAAQEYSEAGKAYINMTMGHKKWNNVIASYAGTYCQNKGFRVYITKQDNPNQYDSDPVIEKFMQSVRRLVRFVEILRPNPDPSKRLQS